MNATDKIDMTEPRYAGFWIRVGAYLIDTLLLLVFIIVGMFANSAFIYLMLLIPAVLYKPLLDGILGGTAGKLALGLRVVDESGDKIGLINGFIRSGVFILPVIPQAIMQVRMIEAQISPFDMEAAQAFQQANSVLVNANYAFTLVAVVSCIAVAFAAKKRGLHDRIANTFVVYLKGND